MGIKREPASEDHPSFWPEPTPLSADNLHLITVAIDHYPVPFLVDLACCKMDAWSIAEKIEKDTLGGGFAITGQRYLHELADEEATLDRISAAFEQVLKEARPDDLLVIFLAGQAAQKDGFRLFTHPGTKAWSDPADADEHALSLEKLQSWTSQIECKRQLIILDLCSEPGMHEALISGLSEQDPQITALTDRNRVIICTEGVAIEGVEGGVLTQILTGIDANLLHLFDPRLRKRVEFEVLKRQQASDRIQDKWFYSKIFYEKEYADVATRILASSTRGTLVVAPESSDEEPEKEGPQDYALVVAVDEFDAPHWRNLRNPIRDGGKVEELLRTEYGYATEFATNTTYDELEQAIFRYAELRNKENLIVFVAGHGHFDSRLHNDGFIVLKDSASPEHDRGMRSYFQFVTLQKILDNLDFKRILLVMDVCFGGKFGYNARTAYQFTLEQKAKLDELAQSESAGRMYDAVDTKRFLDRQLMFGSRYFIASGVGLVKDGDGLHSPFARNVVRALETRGNENLQKDDVLTFDELKMYCAKGINMPVHGHFGSHEGGDFILIPRAIKETLPQH